MTDAAATSTADPSTPKRPRLSDAQRLARLDEQRAKLIARQKNSSRQLDARQKIIVGATVINAMERDADFRGRICALLDADVQRPQDREAITPWLSAT